MGKYTPDFGFVPTTAEENVEQLRTLTNTVLDLDVANAEEFKLTNFWLVYRAVALLKEQTDDETVTIIDTLFNTIKSEYGRLEPKKGSSMLGNQYIFNQHCDGFEIQTYHEEPQLVPGEYLVALLNPDVVGLQEDLQDYWDFGHSTNPAFLPAPPEGVINCNVGVNTYAFYYTPAFKTELEILIRYRLLDNYAEVGGENITIKTAFLEKWNEWQTMGRDFEPEVYLSNAQVPFVADFEIAYKLDGETEFVYGKIDHALGEYFAIKTDELENPLITIERII